jgi:uncharacterized protein (DUF302 family)
MKRFQFRLGQGNKMTQNVSILTGITRTPSGWNFNETIERFKQILAEKGIRLFAQIDHAGEAKQVGMSLRPTQVLIFGSPRAGTPLMQSRPSIALDLPLRALIAEDERGKVWISHYRLEWLAKRHGIEGTETTVESMDASLSTLIQAVAESQNS